MNRHDRFPLTLRQIELFRDCSDAELQRVASLMTPTTVAPHRVLTSEGDVGQQFIVIIEGEAEVSKGSGRNWRRLGLLGAGAVGGEMALRGRPRRSATVTALTRMQVFACTPGEFQGLLDAA